MDIEAILFDMDGVLVDVSNSYRVAIQKTVRYFTDEKIALREITAYKRKGGYNNDWRLTEAILRSRGKDVDLSEIIKMFQTFYLGMHWNGLIRNEVWLLDIEILNGLTTEYTLGIVTGRPKKEAEYILHRFGVMEQFGVVVAMEDTPPGKGKPHPYGLRKAMEILGVNRAVYLGDSIDDMRAAVGAKIIPIGVLNGSDADGLQEDLLRQYGAKHIIHNVNRIGEVLNETFKN